MGRLPAWQGKILDTRLRSFDPWKQMSAIASSMLKKGVVLVVLATAPIVAVAGPGGSNRPYASICDTVVHVIQTQPILRLSIDLACQVRHLGLTTWGS